MATARVITRPITGRATGIAQGVGVAAVGEPLNVKVTVSTTNQKNIYKPIRVTPTDAQTLQWLTPGNTLEYVIITNLEWQII